MQNSYVYSDLTNKDTFKIMTMTTKTITKFTLLALILSSVTGCINTQSTPSMVDYSYVPPSKVVAAPAMPGLEDY
jgi:hypothetical protein